MQEPYTETSKQSRRDARSPRERAGVSSHQAVLDWETYYKRLYELENREQDPLIGIHVGNKVWYSAAQLTALLGPAKWGPHSPGKMERPDKGGNHQSDQIEIPLAA